MVDHVGFGVTDFARSKAFYARALDPLGLVALMEPVRGPRASARTGSRSSGSRARAGSAGRGARRVRGRRPRDQVDAFHAAALAAGATDNGAPGVRLLPPQLLRRLRARPRRQQRRGGLPRTGLSHALGWRRRIGEDVAEKMTQRSLERQSTIAGQRFTLRAHDVVRTMRSVDPEPISSHYVVVAARRFPPKQVISAVTGLDRADFTTHQARRTLMRLGFAAGRNEANPRASLQARGDSSNGSLADRLRPFVGQWIAIRGDDVLHASPSPQELVGWLSRHGQKADSVYRVPESELATTGLAPL